jgi:hypothetical protein
VGFSASGRRRRRRRRRRLYNNGTCTRLMNGPVFLQFTEALTKLYILTLVAKMQAHLLFQEIYWHRNMKQQPEHDVRLLCSTAMFICYVQRFIVLQESDKCPFKFRVSYKTVR